MCDMKLWTMTDVGLVRRDNQDAFATAYQAPHTICVVCDGMGGSAGGQLASHIAVKTFVDELSRVLTPEMSPEQLREASSFCVAAANRVIQDTASQSEDCRDMGTTLVAAVSYPGGVVISNVGDSRAYYVHREGIARVTKDHSLVESMVDRGDITAEAARRHPKRNLITRALGPDISSLCDGYICPMQPGDFLLLCTDGLVDTVTDEEMHREIYAPEGLDGCLNRMLKISKSRGAADNVTAVLMQKLR